MGYACRVVLDSIAPSGGRLTTFEVTFPRIVLAEFNTHRMFSRNSASSRAIPINKMLEKVTEDPFVPFYWGRNQKGMQAVEEVPPEAQVLAREQWLLARDNAATVVRRTQKDDIDLHKQLANRLLEPFMFHTAIVTATEWDNWDGLRFNKQAQPEIYKVAEMMREAKAKSVPQDVPSGGWHLPLVFGVDEETLRLDDFTSDQLAQISCARCARVSYLTHDGRRDPKEDLTLYERLASSGHMSPLEHAAMSLSTRQWESHAHDMAEKWIKERVPMGNVWGWWQFRKMVRNEHDFSKVTK